MNASAPSLASKHPHVQFDGNSTERDTDGVLYIPGHLSLEHKQRKDSSLHESTANGAHRTMQLHRKEGGTIERLFGQMNAHGRQEGREGPKLHDEQTKSSVLHIYSRFIGQEDSR
jgi:hypothetical protein